MGGAILAGDLKAFPLPDVVLILHNNRKTGMLRCQRGDVLKTVDWENGEIVFARSSSPEDRLGAFLVARGKVTKAQLAEVQDDVVPPERLGKLLIERGFLAPQDLFGAVRGQITAILYSLFQWDEGRFEFEDGAPAREKIALNTSVMNLIMEGTRQLDEWSRIKAKIQSDGVILAPVRSVDEMKQTASLSDIETLVLGLVDGRRTVRDIVTAAGRGELEAWQALHALLSAGAVRLQLVSFDR